MQEQIESDIQNLVLVSTYRPAGVGVWERVGEPSISPGGGDASAAWDPVVRDETMRPDNPCVVVFVYDDKAIDLSKPGFLGDYHDALARCDAALLRRFNGDRVIEPQEGGPSAALTESDSSGQPRRSA